MLAGSAGLGDLAKPIAAAHAGAAIFRAGKAVLALVGVALAVAARLAGAAVGRAGEASLAVFAEAVAAAAAFPAVLRAGCTVFGGSALAVAAPLTEPAIDRARRASLGVVARRISAQVGDQRAIGEKTAVGIVHRIDLVERRARAAGRDTYAGGAGE